MRAKAKLLLIEDSPSQGEQLVKSLQELGYDVTWAQSGMSGVKLARQTSPDLVILDVILEDLDGFAVCRWLKMHSETRDTPIIMLTARTDIKDRVEGLNIGADDYLTKPVISDELEAHIFAALRTRNMQRELRQRNSELESMLHHVEAMAITDPLTGLFNRRRLDDVLKREWAVSQRYKNSLSCIMLDLDHFKAVNDQHGHGAGDDVLKQVATLLRSRLREVDLAARFGGEEFVILLPQTDKEGALILAERLRSTLSQSPLATNGKELAVSASFGVASNLDVAEGDAEDLLRGADIALYHAKNNGRNRVTGYDSSLHGNDPFLSSPPKA
jgi:two-component system cell cycle response regulator